MSVSFGAMSGASPRYARSSKTPLGEVIEFRSEIVHPKSNPKGAATFVGLEHIERDTGVRLGSEEILLEEMTGRRSRFYEGDIVYGYLRPYLNKVWIAEFDGLCSVDQYVFKVRPEADRDYIAHFLRSSEFLNTAPIGTTPGQLPRIRSGEIASTLALLPSRDEQRRIAAILDQADDLRCKRREALRRLEQLSSNIFLDMFGEPTKNSLGWKSSRLGAVGTLDRGVSKHRPRNDPSLLGGPYPLIQTGDIANCDGYVRSYTATYSDLGLKQSKLWPAGTLCITIAANIGNTGILTFNACFPDSVVGFTPNDEVLIEFIQQWFGFIQPALEKDAPQFAQKNINLAILRDLVLPLPPLDLQHAFAARVTEIDALKTHQRGHLAKLDALFASLQHRAFRGEL